jgi:7tm Odorant receptor.
VQQEAYGCSWYHRPTSFKFLLAVVIMRAQKPVRLNAGMFYDLSLTTFTQVTVVIIIVVVIVIITIILTTL